MSPGMPARPAACLTLVALGCGCGRPSLLEAIAERQASCVVVVIDAAAASRLHAYGYPRETTPTIDALAASGVLFERVYSQAPSTLLSVPS